MQDFVPSQSSPLVNIGSLTNTEFPTIHFITQDQKIAFITTTNLIRKVFLSISTPLGLDL